MKEGKTQFIPPLARIPTLDGWRAIAIVMVIISHIQHLLGPAKTPVQRVVWILMGKGVWGVSLFFGISGLLITSRLIADQAAHGKVDFRKFYIRRAFRILPPAASYVLFLFALSFVVDLSIPRNEWIALCGFVRNYVGSTWYTGHFWSLAVEEHYYLVWPILFGFLCREKTFPVLVGIAIALSSWAQLTLSNGVTIAFLHSTHFTTDTRLAGLVWGSIVAIYRSRPSQARSGAPGKGSPLTFFLYGGVWIALAHASMPLSELLRPTVGALWLDASIRLPKNWIHDLLESRPLVFIGKRSYGLYVWQQFFLTQTSATRIPMLELAVRLAILLVVTEVSFRYLEEPLLKYTRKLTGAPRAANEPPKAIAA